MISLSHVSKHFGGAAALRDITAAIARGEYVAIVGPSGSGKTTLLRLIAGLERPDAGEIRLQDRLVSSATFLAPPHERRVGMVFQNLALWPHMTAFDHLDFALRAVSGRRNGRGTEIGNLLEMVRLSAKRDCYPAQLSGGEQQRLALARAVSISPEVLLLDEPLNSLDPGLKTELLGEIAQLHRKLGCTILHVTHEREDVRTLAGVLMELNAGRLERIRHGVGGSE